MDVLETGDQPGNLVSEEKHNDSLDSCVVHTCGSRIDGKYALVKCFKSQNNLQIQFHGRDFKCTLCLSQKAQEQIQVDESTLFLIYSKLQWNEFPDLALWLPASYAEITQANTRGNTILPRSPHGLCTQSTETFSGNLQENEVLLCVCTTSSNCKKLSIEVYLNQENTKPSEFGGNTLLPLVENTLDNQKQSQHCISISHCTTLKFLAIDQANGREYVLVSSLVDVLNGTRGSPSQDCLTLKQLIIRTLTNIRCVAQTMIIHLADTPESVQVKLPQIQKSIIDVIFANCERSAHIAHTLHHYRPKFQPTDPKVPRLQLLGGFFQQVCDYRQANLPLCIRCVIPASDHIILSIFLSPIGFSLVAFIPRYSALFTLDLHADLSFLHTNSVLFSASNPEKVTNESVLEFANELARQINVLLPLCSSKPVMGSPNQKRRSYSVSSLHNGSFPSAPIALSVHLNRVKSTASFCYDEISHPPVPSTEPKFLSRQAIQRVLSTCIPVPPPLLCVEIPYPSLELSAEPSSLGSNIYHLSLYSNGLVYLLSHNGLQVKKTYPQIHSKYFPAHSSITRCCKCSQMLLSKVFPNTPKLQGYSPCVQLLIKAIFADCLHA